MRLLSLTSDCPDPEAVAAFHQRATGLELHGESHADVAGLGRPDRLFVGFQWVHDHQPPRWPDLTGQQQATSISRVSRRRCCRMWTPARPRTACRFRKVKDHLKAGWCVSQPGRAWRRGARVPGQDTPSGAAGRYPPRRHRTDVPT
ncbi:VOC family protein [Streptomyces caniferus]|uniref:VOC family protein n=1 Tax=Streptomyces caniferus TaxID=285557 RepID=UPI003F4D58A8